MALSDYDRFITEEFAPNQPEVWESDTFRASLVEKVPPGQWD